MKQRLFISKISVKKPPEEGSYLLGIPAVRALMERPLELTCPVTFLVGENGSGKSTLLEALAVACGFNPEGGGRNFNFSTADTHSELGGLLTISRAAHPRDGYFLRAESFYNVATQIDALDVAGSYGGSLHARSHGEAFLALVQQRFSPGGLYLLDEPEAALSPSRLLTLLVELNALARGGAQLIVATHSPILMALPGARLLLLDGDGIRPVDYRDTEHYRVTRDFLTDPARMLHYLLDT